MLCENCGSPLERFEGEVYCPDCTRYAAERLALRADDEARAVGLAERAGLPGPDEGPADDDLPW
jgi:uncharacterized Zn finger protein (UPF0148 family)